MNKINVFVKCLLLVFILGATSCSKDLQDDVNNLKDRVTTMEESAAQLQQAINNGKLITGVAPVAATQTTPAGWLITFSDKSTIQVHQGHSSLVETDESVTITIDGKTYTLAKAAVYPKSITVIRDKDFVIKGGTVEFNIAVNPSTSAVYTKADFELDYEASYTRGITPDFITIQDVQPSTIQGQYIMTLEWAESQTEFAKNAAIFIILNFKDVEGNPAQVLSATPVIMNEKYVSIAQTNVMAVDDIYLFTDETFTDSVRLVNYHEGYVNTVNYTLAASAADAGFLAVNPLTRYTNEDDKFKFTVVPIAGTNATIWPDNVQSRIVNATASVTDYGRAAVAAVAEDPFTGQPGVGAISAIAPITIDQPFNIHVYKVPANNVIFEHDFEDRWIPNTTVDYRLSVNLINEFTKNGYALNNWDFAIKSQVLKKDDQIISMDNNITSDVSQFNAAGSFAPSYKLLPTISSGHYVIEFTVTATSQTPRRLGLAQSRDFKVHMLFNVVAPKFTILTVDHGDRIFGQGLDTHYTNKLADVAVTDLLDQESTTNISVATDVTPNATPLSYDYDLTDPQHGKQGVRFNPYPTITAPAISDWESSLLIKKPIIVVVKLSTGQQIPVQVVCATQTAETHSATGIVYVQYDRLNLHHVNATTENFSGNYSLMEAGTPIDITKNTNFEPQNQANVVLDPTMIQTPGGIVFSAVGVVQCTTGTADIPSGLANRAILKIDSQTGHVTSIDGVTWSNKTIVLYQTFRVTYTDIWGNTASKDVKVYVKSNDTPVIP